MGSWAPIVLGVVSLACAAAAYGFFAGRRWGYRLGVTIQLLNLTGDFVNVALGIEPRACRAAHLVPFFSKSEKLLRAPLSGSRVGNV
jgi:hypothetical protein